MTRVWVSSQHSSGEVDGLPSTVNGDTGDLLDAGGSLVDRFTALWCLSVPSLQAIMQRGSCHS